jgi:hypothetical protein
MINQASNLIFELFDVSRDDADKYAEDFQSLVEAKSGVLTLSVIENQIPKIYGARLSWRSQKVKERYAEKQKATQRAYNAYINNRRRR